MLQTDLIRSIREKQSYLCIGLDTDIDRIPAFLQDFEDPVFEFNKRIIDATSHLAVAYKPNLAFYEAMGPKGLESLKKTINHIPNDIFTIADAKRGDIGNTAKKYAEAYFNEFGFDSITIAPYMGRDSVEPFLDYENKHVILLALTSNKGSADFQLEKVDGEYMYEKVIRESQNWAGPDKLMYVVGATHPEKFREIRKLAPENFYLVPGIGAQGGDLDAVSEAGLNDHGGLLINSSRSIIYASSGEDFAEAAATEAEKLRNAMSSHLGKVALDR